MSDQTLYKAIGSISDKYIYEAMEKKKVHILNTRLKTISMLAAMFAIVVIIGQLTNVEPVYTFNDVVAFNAKEVQVDLSNVRIETLTREQARTYMMGVNIPELIEGFSMTDAITDIMYNADASIAYDRFSFSYASHQGSELSIITTRSIERRKHWYHDNGDLEESSVLGKHVTLGEESNALDQKQVYFAEFEYKGNYISLRTRGVSKASFISIIKSIIE